jgi:segregation and condensation protein A
VSECEVAVEIVARFLALLELYREQSVLFEQPEPLGELLVSWTGGDVRLPVTEEDYG